MKLQVYALALAGLTGCYDFRSDLVRCVQSGECDVSALRDGGSPDGGDGADGGTMGSFRSEFCTSSGWCWQTVVPHTALSAVAELSPTDVWVMGSSGQVLHWDGSNWKQVQFSSSVNFRAAWVVGPNEFVAATNAGVQRWDGAHFSQLGASFSATDITGYGLPDGGHELWAIKEVGGNSMVVTWSGSDWVEKSDLLPSLFSVAASGPTDVWFVGDTIRHWDGMTLVNETLASRPRWRGVWTDGRTTFIVGEGGTVISRSEPTANWTDVPTGTGDHALAVRGTSKTDLWLAFWGGAMRHWDGTALTSAGSVGGSTPYAISASDAGLWVAGDCGTLSHRVGGAWVSPFGTESTSAYATVHGSAPDDIWAFGDRGVHWDGTRWAPVAASTHTISGVFSLGPTNVFATEGDNAQHVLHFDGTWRNVGLAPHVLRGVWADRATGTAWAVGQEGTILMVTQVSGAFSSMVLDAGVMTALNAAAGSSAHDVWVVGDQGTILHSTDGLSFSRVESPTSEDLISVTVDPGNSHAWVTSWDRTTLEWNGTRWEVLQTAATTRRAISGTAARLVTASVFGDLARGPAGALASEESGTSQSFYGVWTLPEGPSVAVGACGAILAHP